MNAQESNPRRSSPFTSNMFRTATVLLTVTSMTGCTAALYRTLETFGVEKREILVNRVEETQESQEDARSEFATALDAYRAVVNVEAGELENVYDELNGAYEDSVSAAEDVSDRIERVRTVAEDLFEEWDREISEYSDPSLARQSQRLLTDTRGRYREVIDAMERAERSMEPVLTLFGDQVLFLRHNLNARAIGSLRTELFEIEAATESLIRDMDRSIREAARFIETMSVDA